MSKEKQGPEVFRKYFEDNGITVSEDKVCGFISEAMRTPYEPPSEENTRASAALLFEMIQAAKYGESWEPYKKRIGVKKIREKMFDPSSVTLDHPAFALICQHLLGKYTYEQTISLFSKHVYPASKRQIERWIKEIRPRAKETIAFMESLENRADRK